MRKKSAKDGDWLHLLLMMLSITILCGRTQAQAASPSENTGKAAGETESVDCDSSATVSPYIPVDSWIYPAVLRLYSMGYVDVVSLNMRPWTRVSLSHMLDEVADRLNADGDEQGVPVEAEAREIYNAITHEMNMDASQRTCIAHGISVHAESAYSVVRAISGTPLHDSFHLGQTVTNDYGRPYANGFNNYSGASGYATAGPFLVYARAEFQGTQSIAGYSSALATQLAAIDLTTDYYNPTCWSTDASCTLIPIGQQATIPSDNSAAAGRVRLLEGYISTQSFNHVISFGKQDYWQSPAEGASMSYSNDAENIYSFRINRIEPLEIPLLSRLTGPFRYEFMVGPLHGHIYPRDPWVHLEKVSFRPTGNLEFGFERTVIWGGEGHEAVNIKSFLRSFFSLTAPAPAGKNSSSDPGARFGAFDFSYRVPFLRNWATLYADGEVHDDVSPIDAPRRASWRPGVYLSHFPGTPKLDLRVEAVSTDPPIRTSNGGIFMYWEAIQRQGYTNNGQMFGDWIGREAKGGQAWLTYHLSGDEWVQIAYRNQKAAKDFIPGGTTLNDFDVQMRKRLHHELEIKGDFQYERWVAPIYLPGKQTVTSTTIQLLWRPTIK